MKTMSKNAVYTHVHKLHELAVDAQLNYPLEKFEQNKAYNKYVINSTEKKPENTFEAMVYAVRHADYVPQIIRNLELPAPRGVRAAAERPHRIQRRKAGCRPREGCGLHHD